MTELHWYTPVVDALPTVVLVEPDVVFDEYDDEEYERASSWMALMGEGWV